MRALLTLPNSTAHWGTYLTSKIRAAVVTPPPSTIEVWKTEEKGSDVNLACYMLLDAFRKECDEMVVITNDSDLCEPIRMVRQEFSLPVTILHPIRKARRGRPQRKPSMALQSAGSASMVIRRSALNAAQFPPTLSDATGLITKPKSW